MFGSASLLVAAVAGDGVVGIGDGDDARAEGNTFVGKRLGITGAIEKFVVVQDHKANARERCERLEKFSPEIYVRLHGFPFFGIQRAALIQYVLRDADLSDIVKNCGEANLFDFGFGHAEGFGEQRSVGSHFLGMAWVY